MRLFLLSVIASASVQAQLYAPEDCAHGVWVQFKQCTISNNCQSSAFCTSNYQVQHATCAPEDCEGALTCALSMGDGVQCGNNEALFDGSNFMATEDGQSPMCSKVLAPVCTNELTGMPYMGDIANCDCPALVLEGCAPSVCAPPTTTPMMTTTTAVPDKCDCDKVYYGGNSGYGANGEQCMPVEMSGDDWQCKDRSGAVHSGDAIVAKYGDEHAKKQAAKCGMLNRYACSNDAAYPNPNADESACGGCFDVVHPCDPKYCY